MHNISDSITGKIQQSKTVSDGSISGGVRSLSEMENFLDSQEKATGEQLLLLSRLDNALNRFRDDRGPSDCEGSMGSSERRKPDHKERLADINTTTFRNNTWLLSLVEKAENLF